MRELARILRAEVQQALMSGRLMGSQHGAGAKIHAISRKNQCHLQHGFKPAVRSGAKH